MKTRTTLYAKEGMILTNGTHYGRILHLEVGADASEYHEITTEDYESLLQKELDSER